MALLKHDIENLGWRFIKSVSPWDTYKYKTFVLSVYHDEVIISYNTRYAKTSMQLFKGRIKNNEELKRIMTRLKIS